jgi:hypothetical protein
MGPQSKGGFFYYSWKGLDYFLRVVLRGMEFIFLLVVLLAAVSYFGLRAAFNEERVRSVFVDQMQELLHRPVQIDKVLLGPHGVKLRGLRVVKRLDMPGQYLLTSETVLVTIKLSALLQRRLELDQVRLVAPSIHLVRDTAGNWNLADIFTSTHTAQAMPLGRFSLPFSLAAEQTKIEQGLVTVEDRLKDTSYRFENVSLAVSRFSVDRPFIFSAACDNSSSFHGRAVKSRFSVQGDASLAGFDWEQAYLRAKRLDLTLDGLAVRGSGIAIGLPPSDLDWEASLPALGPQEWRKLLGRELELRLPASRWQLRAACPSARQLRVRSLRVEAPPLSASVLGWVDFSSGTLKAEATVAQFPLNRAGDFYPSWRPLGLKGMLSGTIGVAGPWSRVELRNGSLKVSRAAGCFQDFVIDGGDVSLAAAEGLSDVSLLVADGAGRFYAHPFSELSVAARLKKDDLRLERLDLRLLDSKVALKAQVRDLKDPKEVVIKGSVDRVRWEEVQALVGELAAKVSTRPARVGAPSDQPRTWVRTFKYAIPKKFPDTVGRITIRSVTHKNFAFKNADLLWDIRGVSPTLKHVNGEVRVSFGPGRVGDIPAVQASNKFLRIIFLPFIYMHKMNKLSVFSTATAYPKSLDFARIEGEYGLRQGVVTTHLFHVDSPQMVAFADGDADFVKETVDMNIRTRLTSYSATLPEWWQDEKGRAAIAFRVKGDLNLPDLEPRMSKMASDEIERALEEARAKTKKGYAGLDKLRQL